MKPTFRNRIAWGQPDGNVGMLLLLIGYLYGLLFVFDLTVGLDYDIQCWARWSTHLVNNGLGEAYSSDTNYPPLFLYVLYLFGLMAGGGESISAGIYQLKHMVLLFDIASVLLVLYSLRKFRKNVFLALFLIFNIAFFYNTIIWGQADTIYTFFALAAVICACERKLVLSLCCLVLALNMKLQAIIFVPLILMALLPVIKAQWRKLPWAIGAVGLLQLLIILPFILSGSVSAMWSAVVGLVDYHRIISINAFNMWHFIFPGEVVKAMSDTTTFLGLSYKNWGLILFVLFSFLALLPMFARVVQKTLHKDDRYEMKDWKLFLLSGALISVIFFFFNTQMHERYSHPVILFAAGYAFLSRHYLFYIVVSVAYFLNLEGALKAFQLENYHTLIFQSWFIALLFLLGLLIGFYYLYTQYGNEVKGALRALFWRPGKSREVVNTE